MKIQSEQSKDFSERRVIDLKNIIAGYGINGYSFNALSYEREWFDKFSEIHILGKFSYKGFAAHLRKLTLKNINFETAKRL